MNKNNFEVKDLIFSLDIGTRSIIGAVGVVKDKKLNVICEKYKEHEERAMIDGQIHDINLVAKTVMDVKCELEKELDIKLKDVAIAAAGRLLRTSEAKVNISLNGDEDINKDIIRTLELSAVKKAEEEVCKNTDGKLFCVGYSVKGYYLNSYVISNLLGHKGEEIGVEVIATFLPRAVIDSLYAVMNIVNLNVVNLTLEPIAAIEAAVPKKIRLLNIALVDIGAGTSDIAISSKETISAYGMVPMAGDEITEVIAQELLIDFNEAERVKREIEIKEEIKYTDVLGLENIISSDNLKKLIKPTVKKIGETISKKIIEINGNKPPAAVFLVGGGAHTPFIIDEISTNLNIPIQRIAIKDRTAVEECICNNDLGSAGVTVLGIALNAMRKLGENFIDVELNGEVISLFNSKKNTVLDVLLQSGINPSLLIAKNGKSKRFMLNNKKRLIFGTLGENANIVINGVKSHIEAEVKAGDSIEVTYAKNGIDAKARVSEFIGEVNSLSIFIDGNIVNIDPICLINDNVMPFSSMINEDDKVTILLPNTIRDIKKYILKCDKKLYKNNEELEDDYVVYDGEYINIEQEELKCEIETNNNENNTSREVKVIVNKNEVVLNGKESYIFVDIFNYIDFNLQQESGKKIVLLLNGKKASFMDILKDNDLIEVYWSNSN